MRKTKNQNHSIQDFGRKINNSKKEQYQLKDGEYRVRLSDVWPKGQYDSSDRLCRYLSSVLRKGIRCLTTTSFQDVKDFHSIIQSIREGLSEVDSLDEFYTFLNVLSKQDMRVLQFVFKDPYALFSYFNKETINLILDMIDSHFEMTPEEIIKEEVYSRIWYVELSEVKIRDNSNIELLVEDSSNPVPLRITNGLDFSKQRSDLGFIVELAENGIRYVTALNVDKASYNEYFDKEYKKSLSNLKKTSKKRTKKFRLDYKDNPGLRTGPEYLNNLNITEDILLDKFGFAGQFGNCLAQRDRIQLLNDIYLANADLAFAIGCSPNDLSLLKDSIPLGIALAARGSGRARGHFETQDYVINLTKRTLLNLHCGVFAHEFGHAFDNWINFKITGEDGFFSENLFFQLNELPEFKEIINYLLNTSTKFDQDSVAIDAIEGRRKPYWSRINEKFARAFNSAIIEILKRQERRNDFLAYNFNNDIVLSNGETISANPTGQDLKVLTDLFIELFRQLISNGYLSKLDERDLYIKNTEVDHYVLNKVAEDQLRFI